MKRDSNIDKDSLLSRVNGLQAIMVLFDQSSHLEKITEVITETEYETRKDED